MKNLHLITTDKPSRLWLSKLGNLTRCHDIKPIKEALGNNVNIYITDDSKIRNGDWYFDGSDFVHKKTKYNDSLVDGNKQAKKIILTTDTKLIEDGIEEIDDNDDNEAKFIEWLIKNPTCEFVETHLWISDEDDIDEYYDSPDEYPSYYEIIIQIESKFKNRQIGSAEFVANEIIKNTIISKEEPKQDWYCPKCDSCVSSESVTFEEKHQICNTCVVIKQETILEEVDENKKNLYYYKQVMNPYPVEEYSHTAYEKGFIEGYQESTKWQQEKSYSEEEVIEIIKLSCEEGMLIQRTINDKVKIPYMRIKDFTIKILEQFKKK
jgi:hypothetical protein